MTQNNLLFRRPLRVSEVFSDQADVVLFTGDVQNYLPTVPDNSVRLIVSSPPYNIGKKYESKVALDQYIDLMAPIVEGLVRVLASDGSLCWQVGNYVEKGQIFPLDIYYYPLFRDLGLKLRNRIVWHFGHGLHNSRRFSGRYETLLWFTKSDKYVFNLDPVRVPSKYPGKTNFRGAKKGLPSGNPLGKNPADVWEILQQDWEQSPLWNIPNVKANHPEKTTHPCQFPVELVQRCVLALTNEEDWVLDPFMGAGSALIAGALHGRRAMGCDKEQEYVALSRKRLDALVSGTLKIRPLGKPVYEPTGREKVSQIPMDWFSPT